MDKKRRSESIRKRKFKTKTRLLKSLQNILNDNSEHDARVSDSVSVIISKTASDKCEQIHVEPTETSEKDNEIENEELVGNSSVEIYEVRNSEGEEEERREDAENNEDRENSDPCPDINEIPEITKLRQWVVECNVPHAHVDKLLAILQPRLLPSLPLSSKKFMRTLSAQYVIEPMEDADGSIGEFIYLGIETGLKQQIDTNVHHTPEIDLLIHIDGLRLFKSSAKEMWPILCRIFFQPMIYDPFTVAVYAGNSKPKYLHMYFDKFVKEINYLQQEGITIDNKFYAVKIKGFVADTPARSFIKATQGHSGFHCCERCCVTGKKKNKSNVFLETSCEKRTDISFRQFRDSNHHTNATPLLLIRPPVDMIKSFILDFMHLGQGVMKRLLEYWTTVKDTKMGQWAKNELSRRLIYLRNQIPSEFQRKPREIQLLSKWKANEFMFFLLYAGPIVVKGLLKREQYLNFLLFHTACRLLCSANDAITYKDYAQEYLEKFVTSAIDLNLYNADFASINVHNMIHLSDDVENMHCNLFDISAFSFENHLGGIKKLIRAPNAILAQYCRRLQEKSQVINTKTKLSPRLKYTNKNGVISKIQYNGVTVSSNSPNNMFMLENGQIIKISNASLRNGTLFIRGHHIRKIDSVYSFPTNSDVTNMWEIQAQPSNRELIMPIHNIKCKLVHLQVNFDAQNPDETRSFGIGYLHKA